MLKKIPQKLSKNNWIKKEFYCRFALRDERGVSFVEMLLYVAIMSMVLITMARFSLNVHNAYTKNYISTQVHDNLRVAMYYITSRIILADSLDEVNSVLESDPGVLYLKTIDPMTNPIVFSLDHDNGSVQLSEGISSPLPVTSDEILFTTFKFKKLNVRGKDSIGITLEASVEGDTKEHEYTQLLETAVSLRYKR